MRNNIELILMDKDFHRLRAIRAFHSLRWVERYYDGGAFELRLPLRFIEDALRTAYVYRKDKASVGMISALKKDENEITLKGGFLEELLKTRVLDRTVSYEGPAEEVCRAIVDDFCVSSGNRTIEKLRLGEFTPLGRDAAYRQCGKTVYDALRDILTEREASFRLRYDIEDDAVYFDIYRGIDRTASQSENSWCVFSSEYHNVLSEKYEISGDKRNVAFVTGSRR